MRVAGQSLDEHLKDYLTDKAYPLVSVAVCMTLVAALDWWRWWRQLPPSPLVATAVAVLCWIGFLAWLPGHRRRLRSMRQGREGERAVGEFLDTLRAKDFYVFHDVIADGFNLDHVLIGPKGVFALETKTISKPSKGSPEIIYDGNTVRVDGFTPDRDPVAQAKAQARWLGELLEEAVGRRPAVRPVVLYPGWFIISPPVQPEVWVLNPKVLPAFLENSHSKLPTPDVRAYAMAVKQYVRSSKPSV